MGSSTKFFLPLLRLSGGPYALVSVLISPFDWSFGREVCSPTDCSRGNKKAPGAPPGLVALRVLGCRLRSASLANNWNMVDHSQPLISLVAMLRLTDTVGDPVKFFAIASLDLSKF